MASEIKGKKAASVLPPAVGARTSKLAPSSAASMASSCTGRNERQPRALTTWCCKAGWSRSKAAMSEVQLDVVDRGGAPRSALDAGQLAVGDRQAVMLPRVKVGMLVDAVEHVADELLEEQPGGDADLAPQVAGDGAGQLGDVGVVGQGEDSVAGLRVAGVEVADRAADLDQPVVGEAGQADLDGARAVEPGVGLEVDVQPLGGRLQPADALRAVVEGRGAGDDQVQAGEATGVDLVDELAQGVEALLADVAADPLQGLDLVEHEDQPGVARVA